MINENAGPQPSPPIYVETNPVTFVIGNATSLADGQNRTIDGVGFPGYFNPGDFIAVHTLDGASFIGQVSSTGAGSVTFDAPIPITIKPGSALIKADISITPPQWEIIGAANGTISPGTQTSFALADGTRWLKIVPVKGQEPSNVQVSGTFPGSIVSKTYFNGVLNPGGSVFAIDFEAANAGQNIVLTVIGAGTQCLLYALEPAPVLVTADKSNPVPISISLPIPSSARVRGYDFQNFHQPAAGVRADLVIAGVAGFRFIIHSSLGKIAIPSGVGDGASFSVNPGSSIILQHVTDASVNSGQDNIPLPDTAFFGNSGASLEVAFRTAPQNAGNFQSVHAAGWLVTGEPTAE